MQVHAVTTLVSSVGESVLHECLKRQHRLNPNATLKEKLNNVVSRIVPASVPGSPSYHREGLYDLLAIVHKYGMPSFFLTLTADETSELRWPEVHACERFFTPFSPDTTWHDLPCFMATLFYERVQAFMEGHILRDDDPIFGRVLQHTVRYESQVRRRQCSCRGCLLQQAGVILAFRAAFTSCRARHAVAAPRLPPCSHPAVGARGRCGARRQRDHRNALQVRARP